MEPNEPAEPIDSNAKPDPSDPPDPPASRMDRRRFMRVLAVGGTALLAGGAAGARAAAPKPVAPKPSKPLSQAVQKELRTQEKNLADILRVIREYDLPSGSEPATHFKAMRARRGVR